MGTFKELYKYNEMKKIYTNYGWTETPVTIKIICTLKELRYFFTRSLWSSKYRYFKNGLKAEFIECFDPLTWR